MLDDPALRPFAPSQPAGARCRGRPRAGRAAPGRQGAARATARPTSPCTAPTCMRALLRAAARAGVHLHAGQRIARRAGRRRRRCWPARRAGTAVEAEALAVADGVWSELRQQLLGDGPAPPTGHVAYRALVPGGELPAALRRDEVQAWLGPRMHLVQLPGARRRGLNVVAFVEGAGRGAGLGPGGRAPARCRRPRARLCRELHALIEAVPAWRLWPRARPAADAGRRRRWRAAAPRCWATRRIRCGPTWRKAPAWRSRTRSNCSGCWRACDGRVIDVPTALQRYALNRWQRCARVQRALATQRRDLPCRPGRCAWRATWRCGRAGERCWTCPGCTGGA